MTGAAAPDPSPVADRLADILLALETATAAGFRLAALATFDAAGGWAGVVRLRLGDRAWGLSADEARMLARCIGFEDERRATGLLVSLFQSAACDADAMAAVAERAGRPAPTEAAA